MGIPNNLTTQTAQMMVANGGTGAAPYIPIPQSITPRNRRHFFVGDQGHATMGNNARRIPVIDQKLFALYKETKQLENWFFFVHSDVAIDILGSYNPIYGGRPKKLVQMMLDILPGYKRADKNMYMCGLAYQVPALVGVRSQRMRLSAAGLALLDHWAERFPNFAKFLAPYDSPKSRERILSDCYDLAMEVRPGWFEKIDKANVLNQLKADSRELKRLKREEEILAKKRMQQDIYAQTQQQALLQNQYYQQALQQQLLQQQILQQQSAKDWTSTSSSSTALTTPNKGIFGKLFT